MVGAFIIGVIVGEVAAVAAACWLAPLITEPGALSRNASPRAGDLGRETLPTRLPAPFLSGLAFTDPGSRPTEHEWIAAKRLERASDPRNPFARHPVHDLRVGAPMDVADILFHFAEVPYG